MLKQKEEKKFVEPENEFFKEGKRICGWVEL